MEYRVRVGSDGQTVVRAPDFPSAYRAAAKLSTEAHQAEVSDDDGLLYRMVAAKIVWDRRWYEAKEATR